MLGGKIHSHAAAASANDLASIGVETKPAEVSDGATGLADDEDAEGKSEVLRDEL